MSVLADCSHTHRGQTTKTTNKLGRNERKRVFLRKVKFENTGGWLPTNLWSNGKDFLKQESEKRKGRRGQLGATHEPTNKLGDNERKGVFSQTEILKTENKNHRGPPNPTHPLPNKFNGGGRALFFFGDIQSDLSWW